MNDPLLTEASETPIAPDDVLVQFRDGPEASAICAPGEISWMWWCPGCKCGHWTRTKGRSPCWGWNGSKAKPTFSPSILVTSQNRCHSFVIDGVIQFLGDCTHELKGQHVPMTLNKDWI